MKAEKYIYLFTTVLGKKMAIHHTILVMLTKCMTDSLIAVKEFVQIRRIVFKQGIFIVATSAQCKKQYNDRRDFRRTLGLKREVVLTDF